MSTSQTIYYERVSICINGDPYLKDGQIRKFSANITYNNKNIHGFNVVNTATGQTLGGKDVKLSWEEYLVTQANYVNLAAYFTANPQSIVTVTPFSLARNADPAPEFVFFQILPTSIDLGAPGEGEVISRSITFVGVDCSNT